MTSFINYDLCIFVLVVQKCGCFSQQQAEESRTACSVTAADARFHLNV